MCKHIHALFYVCIQHKIILFYAKVEDLEISHLQQLL